MKNQYSGWLYSRVFLCNFNPGTGQWDPLPETSFNKKLKEKHRYRIEGIITSFPPKMSNDELSTILNTDISPNVLLKLSVSGKQDNIFNAFTDSLLVGGPGQQSQTGRSHFPGMLYQPLEVWCEPNEVINIDIKNSVANSIDPRYIDILVIGRYFEI
jgi:hypothetical protein